MKALAPLAAALLLSTPAAAGQVVWTQGWDIFNEPLGGGGVVYNVTADKKLEATFWVTGARPNKLYQVGIHVSCTNRPRFGQFPFHQGSICGSMTREGKTVNIQAAEFGVMTTDALGAGKMTVTVGPLPAGTYALHFNARNGVGCSVSMGPDGGTNPAACSAVFRAPAPVGNFAQIVVP